MTSATLPKFRWLFWVAVFFGAAFYLSFPIHMPHLATIALKGSGVALLTLWAALNAQSRDGWLITAVMGLGALGDVLLEDSQTAGAAAFLAGHATAIFLYLSHRRPKPTPSQWGLALVVLVATPVIAFLLTHAMQVFAYACGLAAMAASAWISRFPRFRVGIGAMLFVASDLMIFANMTPPKSMIFGHLIWPLYFAGQALIAWGVVTALLRWKDNEDLHHRL